MKVIRKFRRTVGTCLLASMVFNCITPTLFAAVRSVKTQEGQPEYLDAQEDGLQLLITEIVHQAIAVDAEHEPSPALMRCYERIVGGYQTLPVNDVMEAMPEMLGYALMKYERGMQPDVTRTVRANTTPLWESVKAPRPGVPNPFEPSASQGPAFVGPSCQALADDLCQVLRLLHIIKKRIGTVNDPVCANSVLGVLGNACEVFGPDSNISLKIAEILTTMAADTALIVADIHASTTTLAADIAVAQNSLCTLECRLGTFITTSTCPVDTACSLTRSGGKLEFEKPCSITFASVADGLSQIYCEVQELETTVTQCCDDLADDIFATQTILCCKLEDIKVTLTECCDDLADDIFDTKTLILECCKQTESNFEFTWSLIEEVHEAVEECCLNTDEKLDTILELLQTLVNLLSD